MNDDAAGEQVNAQARTTRAFYVHAISFVLVMPALVAWNCLDTRVWWVQWPLLGWGSGLLSHALTTFARSLLKIGGTEGHASPRV